MRLPILSTVALPRTVPALPVVTDTAGESLENVDESSEHDVRPTQATKIVRLVENAFDLYVSDEREPFAVAKQGSKVVRMFGEQLRAEVADRYYSTFGSAPSRSSISEAFEVLKGRAFREVPSRLPLRVGEDRGRLVLDTGLPTGEALVIGPTGWHVVADAPVLFRRTNLTLPMLSPEIASPRAFGGIGTPIELLRSYVSVEDRDFVLLVAWLVASLFPSIPHPILVLQGGQGTAKSSTAKRIGSLVDPSAVPLQSPPHSLEDWPSKASGSWIVAIDNVSRISPAFSDALCRAVTGDGIVKRLLYSNNDHAVVRFRRCIILNGIDLGGFAGDLADRALMVETVPIPTETRRSERDLEHGWHHDGPLVLGALLDLTVQVLAVLDDFELDEMPRMADFARIVAAVDRVLGTDALSTYANQSETLADDVVDGHSVGKLLRTLVEEHGTWTGTATDLLADLNRLAPEPRPRSWPQTPRALAAVVNRLEGPLAGIGITVERSRSTNRNRQRSWTISSDQSDRSHEVPKRPSTSSTSFEVRRFTA